MRVLLTTDTIGGVWTYTKELTEGLLQRGCSVALVSFGRDPQAKQASWAASIERRFGDRFTYIPSSIPLEWMEKNERSFTDGAALLQQVSLTFEPDLLHANQFCFGALDLDVPSLVVAHSDVLTWAQACKPQGLEPSAWRDRYVAGVQAGLFGTEALVAPTRWMLEAISQHFTIPTTSVVIGNGRTLAKPVAQTRRSLQAVSAGRMWDPAKNLQILRSVERVLPIVVAGRSSLEVSTEQECGDLMEVGFLEEEDLHDLFRRSAIYIAASVYEPFGLAPIEAAMCGCAIVANDLPSFREVWGDAALYFSDTAQLHQRLEELVQDEDLLAKRQLLSRLRAETFDAHLMTTRYLRLYVDLVGRTQPESVTGDGLLTYVS